MRKFLIASAITISTLLSALTPSIEPSQAGANASTSSSQSGLPIDLCVKSTTWSRHSDSEQINLLRSGPHAHRYGEASDAVLLGLNEWTNDFIVYREYYGASGAADNVRVSGIWSLQDPEAFTNGVRGFGECNSDFNNPAFPIIQIWAFSHDVKKVEWTGNRYVITVKPTDKGFQIFQFPKKTNEPPPWEATPNQLPTIEIVDEAGSRISMCQLRQDSGYSTICK
ncbi:MAG: hypothetical protein F6K41_03290 [Symploca sp. SIO3E6]|nr:hypothetical protein [Caldora sp. SIO3E6]